MIDWGEVQAVGVVGLGDTGYSVIEHLVRRKIKIQAFDLRMSPPCLDAVRENFPQVEILLGELNAIQIEYLDFLVLSPGIDPRQTVLQDWKDQGRPIYGDVELFCQEADAPIIAVTGSNGKSTLVTMIGQAMLEAGKVAYVGGNIGQPVLPLLKKPKPDYYVLELSSFQLESIHSLRQHIAVVANYSPDHLDRYCDFSEYVSTKNRIYQNARVAIVNCDQLDCVGRVAANSEIGFSVNAPADFCVYSRNGVQVIRCKDQDLCAAAEVHPQGAHHWQNALILLAVMHAANLSFDVGLDVIKSFEGLSHRCELVSEKNAVSWYNDSKATNEGATIAAIQSIAPSCEGKMILIAGGDAKGAELIDLKSIVSSEVDHVFVLGKDQELLFDLLSLVVKVECVESLDEAVASANQLAQSGDVVLLSPACSSLDMFRDYQHRGEEFSKCIDELGE